MVSIGNRHMDSDPRTAPGEDVPRRFPLRFLALALVVFPGSACGNPFVNDPVEVEELSTSHDGASALVVGHVEGDVDVVGGAEFTVERTVRSNDGRDPSDRVDQDDGTVSVEAECPSVFGTSTCEVDYRITVPPDVTVTIQTPASAVRVTDVSAAVDVSTESGSIEVSGALSELAASSASGDIAVEVPSDSGPYQMSVKTTNGHPEIEVPEADDGIPLDLSTDSGSITVHAP